MRHIKVYRIERNGEGMYGSGLWGDATDHYQVMHRQPNPAHDPKLASRQHEIHSSMYFGFRSKKQLRAWVHKKAWRMAMAEKGGIVKVFTVPATEVIMGHAQVVFTLKHAQLQTTLCPSSI